MCTTTRIALPSAIGGIYSTSIKFSFSRFSCSCISPAFFMSNLKRKRVTFPMKWNIFNSRKQKLCLEKDCNYLESVDVKSFYKNFIKRIHARFYCNKLFSTQQNEVYHNAHYRNSYMTVKYNLLNGKILDLIKNLHLETNCNLYSNTRTLLIVNTQFRYGQIRHFKTSSNKFHDLLPANDNADGKSKKQSIRKLFSLAHTEKWTLTGAIALLGVSSAVTMSVPFVVGAIIDTIYSGGSNTGIVSLVDAISGSFDITDSDLDTSVIPNNDGSGSSNSHLAQIDASVSSTNKQLTDTANLKKVSAFLGVVFLVGGAANAGRVYLMTTAGQRISQWLRSRVFSSLLRQEVAYFDTRSTGDLVSRLAADTPLVASAVTGAAADGLRSAVMAGAAVAMMVYTSPELSLFGLSVVPPVALMGAYHGRKLRSLATRVQERLADCTQHAEERLSCLSTVRVFAAERREVQQHDRLLSSALAVMRKEAAVRAAFFGMTGLTGNLIILAVLYKGSALVSASLLSVGNLSAFLMYAGYVGISVSGLSSAYTELTKGAGAADRLFELMDRQSLMPLWGGAVLAPASLTGRVEYRNLRFSYPSRPRAPVLEGLSLTVQPGQVVAVVGGSGSGKSTLLSLLLRLYDPQEGTVLVDGRDIREYDPSSLRAAIGVVSQEAVLFSGSVRDNLVYGVVDGAAVPDHLVEEAARQANALDFIRSFPQGLDTVVGERGVLLSGGQRQRLAIARALLTNPRILCLDEATSALDSESERLVQDAVERLMKGRTVITIAHRLSTIRYADQIAVVSGGRVAELGTFTQLMELPDGIFKRLVSRQAGFDGT